DASRGAAVDLLRNVEARNGPADQTIAVGPLEGNRLQLVRRQRLRDRHAGDELAVRERARRGRVPDGPTLRDAVAGIDAPVLGGGVDEYQPGGGTGPGERVEPLGDALAARGLHAPVLRVAEDG